MHSDLTDFKGPCCSSSGSNSGDRCQVHSGWYAAAQSVTKQVKAEVRRLLKVFPRYSLKLTGHSLGAAIATISALNLHNADGGGGDQPQLFPQLVTFGSPRVGTRLFAQCFASSLQTSIRFTHRRDTVVHMVLPFRGYVHGCREAYEASGNTRFSSPEIRGCSTIACADGEDDPECAAQWDFLETKLEDHNRYLGVGMYCDAVKY
jgi:hypothetical protein